MAEYENLERQLEKLTRDVIFFERKLETETNSFRRNLLIEQLRSTSLAKLALSKRLVAIRTRHVENLGKAIEIIKRKN